MWIWKHSRACIDFKYMNGKRKAFHVLRSLEKLIRINYGTLRKWKYQSCAQEFYIRISKGVGHYFECLLSLYTGEFLVYVAMSFSGYSCFLKAEELSSLWLPRKAAPICKGLSREVTGLKGEVYLPCLLSLSWKFFKMFCVVGLGGGQNSKIFPSSPCPGVLTCLCPSVWAGLWLVSS